MTRGSNIVQSGELVRPLSVRIRRLPVRTLYVAVAEWLCRRLQPAVLKDYGGSSPSRNYKFNEEEKVMIQKIINRLFPRSEKKPLTQYQIAILKYNWKQRKKLGRH